ncbi:MAG TPA: VOC family protein [Planctomycetota bacterium]|jgi:catechol 2,3-dioxygenase-like lactoylglutathione lyase family enzyme|nr:VOC family protein [Planctomycetota bacterium]
MRQPRFLGIHPQFRVADLVRTAEHYRDVLGFRLDGTFGDPPVFTQANRDGVVIQLGRALDPSRARRAPDGVGYNAYVWVDDVDALAGEYRGRGADVAEGPVLRSYGCRELVVRDCNGLVLCFAQRGP